jgi:hypothetical protein
MMEDKLGETAFRQISDAFPQCECHPIYHYENIVREGGALNCSTWNNLVDIPKEKDLKWIDSQMRKELYEGKH